MHTYKNTHEYYLHACTHSTHSTHTPRSAVFAGSCQILAATSLCTGRATTVGPHLEDDWLPRRAWEVSDSPDMHCLLPLAPPLTPTLWLLPLHPPSGSSPYTHPLAPPLTPTLWLLPLHPPSGSSLYTHPLAPPLTPTRWLLPLHSPSGSSPYTHPLAPPLTPTLWLLPFHSTL